MSEKFHILRENGLFYSPLGPYDPTQEKWSTMREYLEDVLTKLHPESKLIEATTEREITYQQLYLAGEKVAAALTESGVERRSILHVVGGNCFDWLTILVASYLCDCIISATHPNSPWPECSRNIQTTCSTVLIMTPPCFAKFGDEVGHPFLTHIFVTEASGTQDAFTVALIRIPCEQTSTPEYDKRELDGVCQMLLSSGTSGAPKPIKLDAKAIISNCLMNTSEGSLSYKPSDITLVAQPLAHVGGQNFAFLNACVKGPTLIVTDYPGSVGLLKITQKYRMTHIIAVPTVLNFLAKYEDLESYDLTSLKCILTGASSPNFEMISLLLKRNVFCHIKTN
ncbi:uncharacterized protein LOC142346271 [Convolutriloba macropyga]|uniref:uncharacterized protein LOC142346271 n=1 Tax=Convolutriloba macropyga TaxID=536237 RepID=UPI003F52443A